MSCLYTGEAVIVSVDSPSCAGTQTDGIICAKFYSNKVKVSDHETLRFFSSCL